MQHAFGSSAQRVSYGQLENRECSIPKRFAKPNISTVMKLGTRNTACKVTCFVVVIGQPVIITPRLFVHVTVMCEQTKGNNI